MPLSTENVTSAPVAVTSSTANFTFDMQVRDAADVEVYFTPTGGSETQLTIGVDVTIAINGDQVASPGGTVTPVSAFEEGQAYAKRVTERTTSVDFVTSQRLDPDVIEDEIVNVRMIAQELDADVAAATAEAAASATAAATSATNASTSASAASDSAAAASSSASSASDSAAAALLSEGNAASSATAAAASADAAIGAVSGAGWRYAYSTTTTDADPGAGVLRFDNAAPGSATTVYIDNLDADGSDLSTMLDSWDNVGATAGRGLLRVNGVDTPGAFFVGTVTGSVVDGTGYRIISVTPIAAGGTFTDAEDFIVSFSPAGASGADGADGADGVGLTNGDKGDVTVGGDPAGSTMTINNDAVTLAKIADAALSGADATLVTGTAGSDGAAAAWNGDGDLVSLTAASQAEMEAGTEAAERSMSPLRVAQAIAALASGGLPTALDDLTYTSSDTLTKASDLDATATHVLIEAWGAGGGGGASANGGGGGGGGGQYDYAIVAVSALGATETITIGAGGAGESGSGDGGNGGSTSVGSHVSALGGSGGQASSGSADYRGGDGGGGAPGGYQTGEGSSGGMAAIAGGGGGGAGIDAGPGGAGGQSLFGGAGGGGGADSTGGGPGGESLFGGDGGAGATGSAAGGAGTAPGGGGGGSEDGTSGAGARGEVRIRSFSESPSTLLLFSR